MYEESKTVTLNPGQAVVIKGVKVSLDHARGPKKFMVVVDNPGMINKYWVDDLKEIEILPKVKALAVTSVRFPQEVKMLIKYSFGVTVETVSTL